MTTVVFILAAITMIVLAAVLARLFRTDPPEADEAAARGPRDARDAVASATLATLVLTTAYVIAAPYSLPWYDALTWSLLPLVVPTAVDGVLLARYAVMALAYVPGRVVGMSASVEAFTLDFRRWWAPWAGWLAWLALAVMVRRAGRLRGERRVDPATEGPPPRPGAPRRR